jgi:hypothetical protein
MDGMTLSHWPISLPCKIVLHVLQSHFPRMDLSINSSCTLLHTLSSVVMAVLVVFHRAEWLDASEGR